MITTAYFPPVKKKRRRESSANPAFMLFPEARYIPDSKLFSEISTPAPPSEKHAESVNKTVDLSDSATILICGHSARDQRCGILGPVLSSEFERVLSQNGYVLEDDQELGSQSSNSKGEEGTEARARVGLCSHVGGHKWAGNVIIYVPRHATLKMDGGLKENPLAGMGVWYGRVEPRHVEGLVEETLGRGRIVRELFRGALGADGGAVRLPLDN